MGLSYGSAINLPKIQKTDIGFEPKKEGFNLISFFRTIIQIAELGIALIPGLGVIAETIVGLTAGGLNETLDIIQGNANLASAFLNFGSPIIGGATASKLNQSLVSKIEEGSLDSLLAAENLAEAGFDSGETLRSFVRVGITSSTEESESLIDVAKVINNSKTPLGKARNQGLRSLEDKVLSASEGTLSRNDIRKLLTNLQKARGQINELSASITFETREQLRILKLIGFPEASAKEALKIINKGALSPQDRYSAFLAYIRDFDISDDVAKSYAFKSLRTALRRGDLTVNTALQLPLAQQYNRLVERNFETFSVATTNVAEKQRQRANSFFNRFMKAIKNPGSRDFNDFIVQPLQAAWDANDAGRAPIEGLYRVLKKSFKEQIKKIKTLSKEVSSLESFFTRTGGTLIDSDVVLGYKIIFDEKVPGGKVMTQISFKPEVTYSKKPVIVFATKSQLRRFKNSGSPMNYYLDHWAYSRGGKALGLDTLFHGGLGAKGYNHLGQTALSFLPISALRNLLSITSNIVENIYSMSKGSYNSTWSSKFKNSFERAGINRTFRLAGKVLVGETVSAFFGRKIGDFVGRELQRLGTNVFAPLVKNAVAGKPLTTGLTKAALANKFATGAKSNLRRIVRSQRGNQSVIIQQLSAQRKLQQVNRIPNAVVPGRPYKGIKLQVK